MEVNGAVVSANFFPLLGLRPRLGRFFRQDEDSVPDRDRVAVISDELWRNWFASSPDALGATVKINGTAFLVIGVVPPTFRGVTIQPSEIYIPTMMARAGYHWCQDAFASDCTVFDMIGRLRDGYTVGQAHAEMANLVPQSWHTAKEGENTGITVFPARGVLYPDLGRGANVRFITLLACVAGLLLLVCCVNLAGLLIARNSARTREFAIRTSLGAGSMRLIRQLITESLLLAIGGGVLGLLLSLLLTSVLNSAFYSSDLEGHPLYYNFNPEPRVLLAVIAVSIAAGFLASILPALRSVRNDAAENLKQQSSAVTTGLRLGRWLAGAQTGVAVALAALAGLFATSAHTMIAGVNFEASHVALMRLRPNLVQYSPKEAQRFLHNAIARLETLPGVESVSMVSTGAPLVGWSAQVSLRPSADLQEIECGHIEVGPRYFETLQTPVLRGREFNSHDDSHSLPVAIVSEALAHRLWPDSAAIGANLFVNHMPRQVVGIVKDIPLQNRAQPTEPYVYTPSWQNAAQVDARLLMRVKSDPAALLPLLVREVNPVDPNVPIAETITLPIQIAGAGNISELRITAGFVSYAALLAVLLSAIGLYGVMAFSVSRRKKEIGIRLAVGAKPAEVLLMVIREGMAVIFTGVAIGIVLALVAARLLWHLLYGSGAGDASLYAAAAAVLACIGLLACWVPARRAASIEPLIALREE
jgi:putative ABC transport system permease protein